MNCSSTPGRLRTSTLVWISIGPPNVLFDHVLALAERHQLTTYDTSYLELAQRLGLPLATGDANLVQAAIAVRVEIFQP